MGCLLVIVDALPHLGLSANMGHICTYMLPGESDRLDTEKTSNMQEVYSTFTTMTCLCYILFAKKDSQLWRVEPFAINLH
jgi:hypothetical protein